MLVGAEEACELPFQASDSSLKLSDLIHHGNTDL